MLFPVTKPAYDATHVPGWPALVACNPSAAADVMSVVLGTPVTAASVAQALRAARDREPMLDPDQAIADFTKCALDRRRTGMLHRLIVQKRD